VNCNDNTKVGASAEQSQISVAQYGQAGHALMVSRLSACRWKPKGLAGAIVPALVFPAVDLAHAGALVFGAVDFQPVNHFSFGQALGYLLGHALPRS
jgi:hypothetical protein